MKLVFNSHSKVVQAWYDRVVSSDDPHNDHRLRVRSGNIYAEGTLIYSYGPHFPLARYIPEQRVFLLNSDDYSTSTSKHKSYIRRHGPSTTITQPARFWFPTFLIKADPLKQPSEYLQYFETRMRQFLESHKKARAPHMKQLHLDLAEGNLSDRERFRQTFNLGDEVPALPEDITSALVALRLAA
jgi:hypothetical protein